MTKAELLSTYVLPLLAAAFTALAGFVGTQIKNLYRRWVDDKTKEAVVRTCVKAAEQLYHHLSGPEKLEKAKEGVLEMLEEKGIPISELELNLLIESCVSEFNYGFGIKDRTVVGDTEPSIAMKVLEEPHDERELVYSEEGGSR